MTSDRLDDAGHAFYSRALALLERTQKPFLVGGAYAFARYTGIERDTRDFDVFLRRSDVHDVLSAFAAEGYRSELTFPHWLGKIHEGDRYVDLIFSSGNGVAVVDDEWFAHAQPSDVIGIPVRLIPVEEMIWSKGFVMERERYDGADVIHLIHAQADRIDWLRLMRRYRPYPRVLLAHLLLHGFVFPAERDRVPEPVIRELWERSLGRPAPAEERLCQGTLISRLQYLADLAQGYRDARQAPLGGMTREEIALWTRAAESG
ncbi:MAG TPA: hypothetical protein VEY91_01125 [Candidatus Limnocylindria bacterium]|nr:hypothetical protein [Candidatus Limnocylindria bacterium]